MSKRSEILETIVGDYEKHLESIGFETWGTLRPDLVSRGESGLLPDVKEPAPAPARPPKAIDELMSLIGLEEVKATVKRQVACHKVMAVRARAGKNVPAPLYHILLSGNPGSGKTTVARLIARIFHEEGLISSDRFKEVNRASLLGQYLGETENRTLEIIRSATGGVLFIDEIYSLTPRGRDDRDFGRKVIDTLMPVLSDPDSDIMVIGAGYPEEMKDFVRSNPGLSSRFPLTLDFPDFTEEQLMEIAGRHLAEFDFVMEEEAADAFRRLIREMSGLEDGGNARMVITTIDNYVIPNFCARVDRTADAGSIASGRITVADIPSVSAIGAIRMRRRSAQAVGFRSRPA